jgi:protein phosphatase 1 regulatory subunit 37
MCSPSSSAVTIPAPGKSILKRPAPAPHSLLARFSKFLPVAAPAPDDARARPLKRAHFILPEIAIVYPISSLSPPSTPALRDEKRAIEVRELERRRRVVRGAPSSPGAEPEGWWNMDKVLSFYRECCAGCDEEPDPAIAAAFKVRLSPCTNPCPAPSIPQVASHTVPRTVDLSGVQLNLASASVLSDVFAIDWGLRKVVFRECDLDDLVRPFVFFSLIIYAPSRR